MATGFLAHWKRLFVSYLHPRSLSSTLASPFLLKVCDFVSQSLIVCVHAKSLLSCTILCNTVNCSLPDSSVHGILQARILEWVSMPSSRGSSQPRDQTHISHVACFGWQVLFHQCHLGSPLITSSPCQSKFHGNKANPFLQKLREFGTTSYSQTGANPSVSHRIPLLGE